MHQLRVGLRRLRTALRELHDLGDIGIDPGWEPLLRDSFRALGEIRDLTQLRESMQPRIEKAGGPPLEWKLPAGASGASDIAAPARVVREPVFQRMLLGLIAITLAPDEEEESNQPAVDTAPAEASPDPTAAPAHHASVRKQLRAKLKKLHRQLLRDGSRFEQLEAEAQHRVRKRLKRLRYLAEFAAPLFDADRAARYLASLEPAQDALGEHNDDLVATESYRLRAAQDGRAWFAVGWLSRGQEESVARCRDALAAIGDAEPFWTPRGKHSRRRKHQRR